ncbi:hypothetical protein SAMN05660653_03227 [Desulfonatronum thiosulfatophilum]|uniref:Asparagine synthase n=1 Tax=Desulfonatronum thiosulfatophilum TaxID=617002 RepID=A0A1G6EWE1_9BACT|nr:hypothetical protein [Desulfonatronum thiosulfatophilum]SDB61728.1 hypothetical protein SAMN05660653_03227 [Desulfonatronum thiosulfatophilum]
MTSIPSLQNQDTVEYGFPEKTNFDALDRMTPLPVQELFRQWLLTPHREYIPESWDQYFYEGWHLGAHPQTHVCRLHCSEGHFIGWIFQPQLYLREGQAVFPEEMINLPVRGQPSSQDVERILFGRTATGTSMSEEGFEGMWIGVIFGRDGKKPFRRVYPGPTHSVLFSPSAEVVATSHNLIPDAARDIEISRAFDLPARQRFYSFGLTAFKGVQRLLPNHYLDLDSFNAVRHWPTHPFEQFEHGATGAERIVEHSRRLLWGLSKRYSSYKIFLSAGRDSRAIAAIARPLLHEDRFDFRLNTTYGSDLGSRVDLQASIQLARIMRLPHDVTKRVIRKVPRLAILKGFVRIGEAVSGPSLASAATSGQGAAFSGLNLAGMAGEAGRAFYWAGRDSDKPVGVEEVNKCVGAPVVESTVLAAERWLAELPAWLRDSPPDVFDLLYVEQRLGCWEAPVRYLYTGTPHTASLMASGFNIETMLRLPYAYRKSGRLQHDMIAHSWPELLSVPFNEPRGFLRFVALQERARNQLRALRRALRSAIR